VILLLCVVVVLSAVVICGCLKRTPIEPTAGMAGAQQDWIRVLLFKNKTSCTVSAPNGFVLTNDSNSISACFGSSAPVVCSLLNGQIIAGGIPLAAGGRIIPADPFVFFIDGKAYRGNLVLQISQDAATLLAINELPMESYLMGVIGAEMYSYWEPEALKAQAITCRTYASYTKDRHGGGRDWDVIATQANQVYQGLASENAPIRQAVADTQNQILTTRDDDGQTVVFPSYFSSVCGGHTEDSGKVFGQAYAPLTGVLCPNCEKIARSGYWNWKPVRLTRQEIQRRLFDRYPALADKLDEIVSIEPIRIGQIGRIVGVRLLGKDQTKDFLRGEDFRLSLDSSGMKLPCAGRPSMASSSWNPSSQARPVEGAGSRYPSIASSPRSSRSLSKSSMHSPPRVESTVNDSTI